MARRAMRRWRERRIAHPNLVVTQAIALCVGAIYAIPDGHPLNSVGRTRVHLEVRVVFAILLCVAH